VSSPINFRYGRRTDGWRAPEPTVPELEDTSLERALRTKFIRFHHGWNRISGCSLLSLLLPFFYEESSMAKDVLSFVTTHPRLPQTKSKYFFFYNKIALNSRPTSADAQLETQLGPVTAPALTGQQVACHFCH